ncbi:MFS transporter [Microbacterium protaetiae]|uniref:MFS transporter n=1 Tax=Microbacterium protaetiae TaxID=2509458 RepID=A0A4P6EDX0_9MICO|nr:MFS transporter [Microbacterium protaetiae]QAY59946.1 MFS transporter [Microbacterium protaetiae]
MSIDAPDAAAPETAASRAPRLRPSVITRYAIGSIGTGGFATLPGLVLTYYLTDSLGVAAIVAGIVITAAKVWDVIIDPIVGALSDRDRARHGTRRRLMLVGACTIWLFFALTFATPPALGPVLGAIWVLVAFLLTATAFSLFQVPYIALPAELTPGYNERTRLLTWRVVVLTLAILLFGAGGPALRRLGGDPATGYLIMGAVAGIVLTVGMLVATTVAKHAGAGAASALGGSDRGRGGVSTRAFGPRSTTENGPDPHSTTENGPGPRSTTGDGPDPHSTTENEANPRSTTGNGSAPHSTPENRPGLHPTNENGLEPRSATGRLNIRAQYAEGIDTLRRSAPFRTLLSAYLLQALATGLMLTGAQYVATWVLHSEAAVELLFAALIAPAFLAAPVWGAIAARLGKERTFAYASVLFALAALSLLGLRFAPGAWAYAPVAVAGIAYAGMQSLPMAMLPDVISHDERAHGPGRAGTFSGVWTAGETTGMALGATVLSIILAVTGYVSSTADMTVTQPDAAVTGIVVSFSAVPAVLIVLSLVALGRYRLRRSDIEPGHTAPGATGSHGS